MNKAPYKSIARASPGAFYNDILHTVSWNLSIPAKTAGLLCVGVNVPWGLAAGTEFLNTAQITQVRVYNTQKNCLFLNGIGLRSFDKETGRYDWDLDYVRKCAEFAGKLGADWVMVYHTGTLMGDVAEVVNAMIGARAPINR